MTKEVFLQRLSDRLSGLPRAEREEQVNFYSEMIDDRMEEGLSQEEAVAAVGSADEIAGQILAETGREEPKKKGNTGKTVLIIAGSPVWFPVAFSLYISLWSVAVSLWAVFGSLCGGIICGIFGGAVMVCMSDLPGGLLLVAGGLVCAGLAIFMFFACRETTKGIVWLTKRCFKACFSQKEDTV